MQLEYRQGLALKLLLRGANGRSWQNGRVRQGRGWGVSVMRSGSRSSGLSSGDGLPVMGRSCSLRGLGDLVGGRFAGWGLATANNTEAPRSARSASPLVGGRGRPPGGLRLGRHTPTSGWPSSMSRSEAVLSKRRRSRRKNYCRRP